MTTTFLVRFEAKFAYSQSFCLSGDFQQVGDSLRNFEWGCFLQ
jgi:hypothetical protein